MQNEFVGIRKSAISGIFYPKDTSSLSSFVRNNLDNSLDFKQSPKIIVSPHAGFMYSGATAACAYRQLQNLDKSGSYKILLLGPSHLVYLDTPALSLYDRFETPLGVVKVDIEESLRLKSKFPRLIFSESTHRSEHSLETQLPFLQTVLTDFTVVPMVYADVSIGLLSDILEEFLLGANTIAVISSDLSHYRSQKEAFELDSYCIKAVEELDLSRLDVCEACGKAGLAAAISYALKHNLKSKTLDYKTSADTTGDDSSVVGYASFMFY